MHYAKNYSSIITSALMYILNNHAYSIERVSRVNATRDRQTRLFTNRPSSNES